MSSVRSLSPALSDLEKKLVSATPRPTQGRVLRVIGPMVHALLPDTFIGELVYLRPLAKAEMLAEVVGLDDGVAILAPIGSTRGLNTGCEVVRTENVLRVPVGPTLLGRVVDGLGREIDGKGQSGLASAPTRPCEQVPTPALKRQLISHPFQVGIRVIDGLLTCAEGQRFGIYGEPGGGKSTLLGQIIRGANAEVVVVALIGERGREVREFIERQIDPATASRCVIVVETSDSPAMARIRAAHTAATIAESFRDDGRSVLLVMDSVTRFARAMREVGLAAGEPPTRRGFPPSVLAHLPQLLERSGPGPDQGEKPAGNITAFYTVLVEGDGTDDPIAEETRSLLDGHIVLSPKLAAAGQFPAIDVLASRSRIMDAVIGADHQAAADRVRGMLNRVQDVEFLVQVGEYQAGSDQETDEALTKKAAIRSFMCQGTREVSSMEQTVAWLRQL